MDSVARILEQVMKVWSRRLYPPRSSSERSHVQDGVEPFADQTGIYEERLRKTECSIFGVEIDERGETNKQTSGTPSNLLVANVEIAPAV